METMAPVKKDSLTSYIKRMKTAEWIYSVIDSCQTKDHFDSVWNLVRNFQNISSSDSIITQGLIKYYCEKYNDVIEKDENDK